MTRMYGTTIAFRRPMIPTTKIIATLGPASSRTAELKKMITAGLDVVRLNFSHGSTQDHLKAIERVRLLNKKMRRSVKILQDLEGYRIRIGDLSVPREAKKRNVLFLVQKQSSDDPNEIPFDYSGPLSGIPLGAHIYIDDGKILLTVVGHTRRALKVRVVVGGRISAHKGINIIGAHLVFPSLTLKDKIDMRVALEQRLDYVAQSFVRTAGDIELLRKIIAGKNAGCQLIAKIENPAALDHLDEIIDASDGIMIARGDLGISVPIYKVPVLQKEIIKKCRGKGKPVIVATQMLDSMTDENYPTRAEVTDVATAIFDGATHVMLSAETAVGKHPARVVSMMNKIVTYTEQYQRSQAHMHGRGG